MTVFIGRASKRDNRIWLTAARDDRVSFGAELELFAKGCRRGEVGRVKRGTLRPLRSWAQFYRARQLTDIDRN